jgi:glycosyltransferase involved in cell wall biosynthesis
VKPSKKIVLIVGAFPRPMSKVVGGILTSCRTLVDSKLAVRYELLLLDSTQAGNPPPIFIIRIVQACKRLIIYSYLLFTSNVKTVILFVAGHASLVEKGTMAWVAKLFGKQVLMFPRAGILITSANTSYYSNKWIRTMFQGATHILCQGIAWQLFIVHKVGFNIDKTTIIYNWTATEDLLLIGEKRIFGLTNKKPVILFLGWLEEDKGVFNLLNCSKRLLVHYDFELLIAGDGRASHEAMKFVDVNGLTENITFLGWISGKKKAEILSKSDVLVLPSWEEGFPNALVEAMSAKLAVIATTVGTIADVVTSEENVLLVPPKDETQLEKAIERMIIDKEFRFRIAESGHLFAKNYFTVDTAVDKLTMIIDNDL